MPAKPALRRLLRLFEKEEEQRRTALERAMEELRQLHALQKAAAARGRLGRELVRASIVDGDGEGRLAGLEETEAAQRWAGVLEVRAAALEETARALREEYLRKRVERRQAETLVERSHAREQRIAERRAQQGLDEAYLRRRQHGDRGGARENPPGAQPGMEQE